MSFELSWDKLSWDKLLVGLQVLDNGANILKKNRYNSSSVDKKSIRV